MKHIIAERFAKLIDLKSIITIGMVYALINSFTKGIISANEFIPLVTMILTFYFARKDDKDGK